MFCATLSSTGVPFDSTIGVPSRVARRIETKESFHIVCPKSSPTTSRGMTLPKDRATSPALFGTELLSLGTCDNPMRPTASLVSIVWKMLHWLLRLKLPSTRAVGRLADIVYSVITLTMLFRMYVSDKFTLRIDHDD